MSEKVCECEGGSVVPPPKVHFLIHQAAHLYQREPLYFWFCDLSVLMFVLHFQYFKKQAKFFLQTNVFRNLPWRWFSGTREGLQVPASLLS